jgi:hypothetical protein
MKSFVLVVAAMVLALGCSSAPSETLDAGGALDTIPSGDAGGDTAGLDQLAGDALPGELLVTDTIDRPDGLSDAAPDTAPDTAQDTAPNPDVCTLDEGCAGAQQGDFCDATVTCRSDLICHSLTSTCQAPAAAGGLCSVDKDCDSTLRCQEVAGTKKCVKLVGENKPCTELEVCKTGLWCNDGYTPPKCAKPGGADKPCTVDEHCAPGFGCNLGFAPAKCTRPGNVDAPCGDASDCADARPCIDSKCACIPDCEGLECGDDGCGGSCGTCESPLSCVEHACKGCGDTVCEVAEKCGCPGDCGACAGGDFVWVTIPAGKFIMGCVPGDDFCKEDENPAHSVTISSFQMLEVEVTEGQYEAIHGSNPSYDKLGPAFPVERVTWTKADEFCKKIGARLPYEAEWEYAARAGTTTIYGCGNDSSCIGDIGWWSANAAFKKHEGRGKPANAFGLYDTTGNVWEWVYDWWSTTYYDSSPGSNPHGPADGWSKVIRGGAFPLTDLYGFFRLSYRHLGATDKLDDSTGFRCARKPK